MSELKVGDKRVWNNSGFVFTILAIGNKNVFYTYTDTEFMAILTHVLDNSKPYKEPVKMVKWYRPKIIWNNAQSSPQLNPKGSSYFRQDKRSFSFGMDVKVVEWDEIELPENLEEC